MGKMSRRRRIGVGKDLEYSLKALTRLAMEEGVLDSGSIAKSESIPRDFLIQLLQPLRDAGFVESCPGRLGGYRISADLDKVSVLDVERALSGAGFAKERKGVAGLVNEAIEGALDKMTLADVMLGRDG